jgi:hypothetical protein
MTQDGAGYQAMNLNSLVSLAIPTIAMIGILAFFGWLLVWVPMVILDKAGFPRAYGVLAFALFPISMVLFALAEWPIVRELAWLRMKVGEPLGHSIALVEAHAVDLEARGESKKAIEVYEELTRRDDDEKNQNQCELQSISRCG